MELRHGSIDVLENVFGDNRTSHKIAELHERAQGTNHLVRNKASDSRQIDLRTAMNI